MTDISVASLPGPDDLPLTEGRPDQVEPAGQTFSGPSPGAVPPMVRLRALDAQRALLRPLAFLSRREAQVLQELAVVPQVTSGAMVAALQQLLNTGENPPGSNCNAITQRCGIGCVAWCDEGWWTALFNAGFQSAGHIFVPGVQTDYWFGDAYVPDTMHHFQAANSFSKTPVAGAGEIHYWSGVNNPGDSHIAGFVQYYEGTGTHLNIESNHNNVCEYVKRSDDDPTIMGYCIPPFADMNFPNVADISSAQRNPDGSGFDAGAYKASGRLAVIIKGTEGTGYHFAGGDVWAEEALAAGLVVGRYHWAGSSTSGVLHDPDVEGDYFLSQIGAHRPGLFAACDFENPNQPHPPLYGLSASAAAQWVEEFLNHLAVHGGYPGAGYSMSGSGVVQLLNTPHLKWYAAYPGPVPMDRALHQFTDNGVVPGVGRCDDSYCYVDLVAFAQGEVPVRPTFHPSGGQEDSTMALITGPAGSRVDLVVVGLPDPKDNLPAGSGPVYHVFGNTLDELLSVQQWESLGGAAYAVSGGWTADGSTFVVSALGVDGRVWVRSWDAAGQWTDWRPQVSGTALTPA